MASARRLRIRQKGLTNPLRVAPPFLGLIKQKKQMSEDNPTRKEEFRQEIINLKETLRQEKLKKADELLAHRLVYSAIILVILLIVLAVALNDASNIVQWLCIIPFFVLVIYIVGKIGIHYKKEKDEANRE
jgi:hypothetical protein